MPNKVLRCLRFVEPVLQGRLEELEGELTELNGNAERLQRSYAELGELQLVLEHASRFFDDDQSAARSSTLQSSGAPDGAVTACPAFFMPMHASLPEVSSRQFLYAALKLELELV